MMEHEMLGANTIILLDRPGYYCFKKKAEVCVGILALAYPSLLSSRE